MVLLLVLTGVPLRMDAVCMLPVLATLLLLPDVAAALELPTLATGWLRGVLATWGLLEGERVGVGDAISCIALIRRLMPSICSLSS